MTDIVELLRNEMKHSDELCYKAADEIEKLRAENAKLAASNHAYLSDYQEAADEIEKLRAALQIARRDALEKAASLVDDVHQWDGRDEYCESCKGGAFYPDARDVAATIRALGEKQ